jgi:hypothetical protein
LAVAVFANPFSELARRFRACRLSLTGFSQEIIIARAGTLGHHLGDAIT